ncbi:MAG: alkaline phosphatase [Planctomycetia bacterium]|nr:alkaline phosphatase [Planctomycetia bacterium]
MRKKIFLFLVVLGVLFSGRVWAEEAKTVKYVFLFIGDGMALPQRMVTDEYLARNANEQLLMNTFPVQVPTVTRSANALVTDSAAGGTALACGTKTNNGVIGLAPDGSRLESVAEVARNAGRKVGIITTVTINHATPAAFYGHRPSRNQYYALGLDLIASNFDYFAGGGVAENEKKDAPDFQGRITKLAREKGYQVVHDTDEFHALKLGCGKVIVNQSDGSMPPAINRAEYEGKLELTDLVRKGIELLDNPKGFFMMVEGGQIDGFCHANNAAAAIWETILFDRSIRIAYEFAQKHPDETLIVVTADHETGGLTLGYSGVYASYSCRPEMMVAQKGTGGVVHNAIREVLSKEGSTFDDMKPVLTEWFGLNFEDKSNPLYVTEKELSELEAGFQAGKKDGKWSASAMFRPAMLLLTHKAGLGWTTGGHTALPVLTSAYGAGAERFHGFIDNTDVANLLKPLLN